MKKIFIAFILLPFLFSCSEIEKDLDIEESKINLSLLKSNSYSATFNSNFSTNFIEVRLIWSNSNDVTIENKIGEQIIENNNSIITINNLKSNENYFFKLYSLSGGSEFYSNEVSTTISEIEITFDNKILSSSMGGFNIDRVRQVSDGFIIGATLIKSYSSDTSIEIIKLDNDFNLLWSFNINQGPNSDNIKEILDLQDGNYIMVGQKFTYTSLGTYNHSTYMVKFNDDGNLSWTKYYYYNDISDTNHCYNHPREIKTKPGQLKIITEVDTTYHTNGRSDAFLREFEIDKDGNITSDKIIGDAYEPPLWFIEYDIYGNKYNYGKVDIHPNDGLISWDGMLEKYDIENNLVWSRNFGNYGADDSIDRIVFADNKIVSIGMNGHENGFDGESKWVIRNNTDGNTKWDFKETRKDFIYQGRDVIFDNNYNTIALFFDIFYPDAHVYNLATVTKIDDNGNVIWQFSDGEDYNKDGFFPSNIFIKNDEYSILGVKEGIIWLKKFVIN